MPPVRYRVASAHPGRAAFSIIDLTASTEDELDNCLRAITNDDTPIGVGSLSLRPILGVDHGVIARPARSHAQLMPHASAPVLAQIEASLDALGLCKLAPSANPLISYPEASDLQEACMLDTLRTTASPLALDVLAVHAERWRSGTASLIDTNHARSLDRLLTRPTVAVIGASNIGKSSLANALAARDVAIEADEPGTTRDHLGIAVELDGLGVWWLDTPGLRERPGTIEARAIESAMQAARTADLLVHAADADAPFHPIPPDLAGPQTNTLRVRLRCDRAEPIADDALRTAARTGAGLDELARRIRHILVPDDALAAPGRWRFHPALDA